MCFSSSASFTSAGLLIIIGALALYKTKSKEKLMFALVPSLFAAQQAAEGCVWLSLQDEQFAALQQPASYFYLFFAHIVWPTWVPVSLWLMEKNVKRKKILAGLSIFGAALSAYLAGLLFMYGVTPEVACSNIDYVQDLPLTLGSGAFLLYAIPTILPFLISSISKLWIFGVCVAGALLISYLFWYHALGSVWCFFAAILSGMILFFLDKKR